MSAIERKREGGLTRRLESVLIDGRRRKESGLTDGDEELWVELLCDPGGGGADEVVDVVVGDMPVLDLVGHGGGEKEKEQSDM